jgi:phosphatidylinositol alpha 1,6-mannosyltransferase
VLEAMALGRAVVATRTKGPEELVSHGSTGLLVPPGDDRALAQAITSLAGDPHLRRGMGAAARHSVGGRSASAMAAGFADLYRRITPRVPEAAS